MPSIVNEILFHELKKDFEEAGSCLVVSFNALTVAQDEELRGKFRDAGVTYKVVKNRLVQKVLSTMELDLSGSFTGKCAVVFAPEEKAIGAAKVVQDWSKKMKPAPVTITGGIIEGTAIGVADAGAIADMPDRNTVNAQLASAIIGPARAMAGALNALGGGLARCLQAKIDKGEG